MSQERQLIQRHCDQEGAQLLWHDLGAFGDEGRLVRALFEGEQVKKWRCSALYLVLDSFDECYLRIETLSKVLLEELKQLPVDRLFLFIACRPAYWPRSFEEGLRKLWKKDGFTAVELAPLRERDVADFAYASGVDAAKFLQEVAQRGATALALRPVTLRFLLAAFKQGRLPVERWPLYFEGCTLLAQESNESREESGQRRIVQSEAQLLEVVLESLGRLQRELHDEPPLREFLWNEWREGEEPRFRPKKENQLSDWIKHHLRKDLFGHRIVVNREVEIRPTEPLRPGQRTDLLVQAFASEPEGREQPISVIIEVKGCWNPDLWVAMQEQLVRRYLAENSCQHGVYLVGWYAGAHWNNSQPHPTEGRLGSHERARQLLEEQARALSQNSVQVRAFVLDAAFRGEREAAPPRRRR